MNNIKKTTQIQATVTGNNDDPFSFLGMHQTSKGIEVRVFIPTATKVRILDMQGEGYPTRKMHEEGYFQAIIKDRKDFFEYQLEVTFNNGDVVTMHDPYSFLPIFSEHDLYLFNTGDNRQVYDRMGAHQTTINHVNGTYFAVWAPCAKRVSVVGEFNGWDGRRHVMRRLGTTGVWEIFMPLVGEGDHYKYEIKAQNNDVFLKTDPYGFYTELRPQSASIVTDLEKYKWQDKAWLKKRASKNPYQSPMNIYEAHMGSWMRVSKDENGFISYRDAADKLIAYVVYMGYTHLELMPLMEHPFDGSWGYQVTGYYAATARYGKPEDLMYFIDTCHKHDIGVILDWVPAHYPKDAPGLRRFDGSALYEHEDPRLGEHLDWGTMIFNYGRNEVKNFLIGNANFWFEKYHIDGLRVDAVASMLYLNYGKKENAELKNQYGGIENVDAVSFIRHLNHVAYENHPGIIMIAEESTSWPMVTKPPHDGGLGFGMKWNMGWMNDFLKYMSMDSINRKHHHHLITFSLMYAFSENYILPISHDEVVHGKHSLLDKMPGDYWQKFAGMRVALAYQFAHPGKKLLFMGCEYGQFIEWKYDDSLDWHLLDYDLHGKLHTFTKTLNWLYRNEKAFYEVDDSFEGFQWIDCDDAEHSIVTLMRQGKKPEDTLVMLFNFTPVVHDHYRIGVPFAGYYNELMNTDAEIYGGSNVGNLGGLQADAIPCNHMDYSIAMRVPPLAAVIFKPV
ncbi:MAG: 1,4-alpha-glucan branching protein GlgB [Hyphomonadaceae bacterium]|nr:1,4-alpha-glucan branching protein GlgB [Clostridia bacterium]